MLVVHGLICSGVLRLNANAMRCFGRAGCIEFRALSSSLAHFVFEARSVLCSASLSGMLDRYLMNVVAYVLLTGWGYLFVRSGSRMASYVDVPAGAVPDIKHSNS